MADGLHLLLLIADPDSPNHGMFSFDMALQPANSCRQALVSSEETSNEVFKWLSAIEIHHSRITHSKGRNWLEVNATVAEIERLLKTEYHLFQHQENGGYRVACDSYHLPKELQSHLDGLQPIAQKSPAVQVSTVTNFTGPFGLTRCDDLITIDCLRTIYNFGKGNYSHAGNKMGIAEWADFLNYPDLKPFFNNFTSPQIPADTLPEFVSIDGGKRVDPNGTNYIESALDIESAYSIIWPQQIRQYQVGDSVNVDSVGTFNIFLDALDASYCTYQGGDQPYLDPVMPAGASEAGGCTGPLQLSPTTKSKLLYHAFTKNDSAAIFATGDAGVANRYNAAYNNSCVNAEHGYVLPQLPRQLSLKTRGANAIYGGEVAVAQPNKKNNTYLDFYSGGGGGVSNICPRPQYQDHAVKVYLDDYAPKYNDSVFNRTGRGIPDVSAMGWNITTVYFGRTSAIGGTSAAIPIFAAILTLINEERLQVGKTPIGFANPVFYLQVSGNNPGCGTEGFPASKGWDAVTGLGTPDFEKMKIRRG
ncbi:uncharacterized protein MYCFIDRAFT_206911 [Pseudocercospora fijiensis CIRAD86]|uniref:Peptidase S53 domain-containing protein n=1 Tax=Pseudocercospora fijiensis (strain CIRAD86) TaxID=383855 RepID=M3A6G3_PSEFD|nr:uncharacterized protein MYCFIDRAFT_206911 [Pseudocercospora fijiensis CIRAD86]EME86689.1 hypothetical protein MYCFIDRAFT_206911 [Pseudocercospora fijiensis CIRAD86]